MGRPKNENFSATKINTEGHNLDNCNCTATWLRATSLIKTYNVILSHGYHSFTLLSVRSQINPWPNLAQYPRNCHEFSSIMLPLALNLLSRLFIRGHSSARNLSDCTHLEAEWCVTAAQNRFLNSLFESTQPLATHHLQ